MKKNLLLLAVIILIISTNIVHSQSATGNQIYTVPCAIYDSPIIFNEKLKIINLGPKINTSSLDYAPTITLDGQTLFFVSNRKGSKLTLEIPYNENAEKEFLVVRRITKYDTVLSIPEIKKILFNSVKSKTKLFEELKDIDSVWVLSDSTKIKIWEQKLPERSHDFWFVKKNSRLDTNFSFPMNLDTSNEFGQYGLNTSKNEGAASISSDGKLIFFTGCNRPDGYGDCDIYYSIYEDNKWSKPVHLDSNVNSKYWDSQPSIAPYNKRLYFASNRPSSFKLSGNMNIWYSDWSDSQKQWLPAKELIEINSTGKDVAPFIASDGVTLFFSSTGFKHNYGGLDFYVTRYDPINDNWSTPANLGQPLNTSQDEMFICLPASGDIMYFSSKRTDIPGYVGDLDIYMAYVPDFESDYSCSENDIMKVKCYPNPFSQTLSIEYHLDKDYYTKLSIYSLTGEVDRLIDDKQNSGLHKVEWDGTNYKKEKLSSGLYFLELNLEKDGNTTQIVKKIMLMR